MPVMETLRGFGLAFIPLFVAIDALAVVPAFLTLTEDESRNERARTLRDSALTGLVAGLGFLAIGRLVFRLLGITIPDFQIAGGAVLFAVSLTDLIGSKERRRLTSASAGVVPLGVPLLVGPAVLTTLLVTVDSFGLVQSIVAFVLNMLLAWLILSRAELLTKLLGSGGSRGVAKIMSLLMAAIGVTMMRRGLQAFLAGG
jgi:multiple antibiotic resistance protein